MNMKKVLSAMLSLALALSCCAGFALGEEPLAPPVEEVLEEPAATPAAPDNEGDEPGDPAPHGDDQPVTYGYNGATHRYTVDGADISLEESAVMSISSLEEWGWFADYVNCGGETAGRTWELTQPVSTSGDAAVGTESDPFSGVFDGGGFTISANEWQTGMGVFQYLSGATVKNLHVQGALFAIAGVYIGGIAGKAKDSIIENCHAASAISVNVTREGVGGIVGLAERCEIRDCTSDISIAAIVTTGSAVGGIVGKATDTTIENCVNEASISSIGDTGGIAGSISGGCITSCTNDGSISGSGTHTGGIVGKAGGNTTIEDCANQKPVSGGAFVGGIAGAMDGGEISQSWNIGEMVISNANAVVGGIAGQIKSGSVSECFNTGPFQAKETSGKTSTAGGIVGVLLGSGGRPAVIEDCYYISTTATGVTVAGVALTGADAAISQCYTVLPPFTPSSCGITPKDQTDVTVTACYYDGVRFPYPAGEGTRLETGYLVSGRITDLSDAAQEDDWSAWTFEAGAYPQLTCMLENPAAEEAVVPRTPYLYGADCLYTGSPVLWGTTADADFYYHLPADYTLVSFTLQKKTEAGTWETVSTAVEPGTYQAELKYTPPVSARGTQTWTFTIQAPRTLSLSAPDGTFTPEVTGVYLLPPGTAWQLTGDTTVYESGAPVYLERQETYPFTAVSEGGTQT